MTRQATLGAILTLVLLTSSFSGAVAASPTVGSAAASDASVAPLAQETAANQTNETANATATVAFPDQATKGDMLVINRTNLSAGGFVLIFHQNGTLLGNTTFLEPGVHQNVTVNLTPSLEKSQVVIAVPHRDTNDNQMLDFNVSAAANVSRANVTKLIDAPYTRDGVPINEVAFVIVGNATRRTTTAANQSAAARTAPVV